MKKIVVPTVVNNTPAVRTNRDISNAILYKTIIGARKALKKTRVGITETVRDIKGTTIAAFKEEV